MTRWWPLRSPTHTPLQLQLLHTNRHQRSNNHHFINHNINIVPTLLHLLSLPRQQHPPATMGGEGATLLLIVGSRRTSMMLRVPCGCSLSRIVPHKPTRLKFGWSHSILCYAHLTPDKMKWWLYLINQDISPTRRTLAHSHRKSCT